MWKRLIRPLLFRLPAERAHYWSMGLFSTAIMLPGVASWLRRWRLDDARLETSLWGKRFRNPVGLAAGFDKDARWLAELALLGFGSIEVGSVTGQPQPGNPTPRLFRLPTDRAVINRMGFNNQGAVAMAQRLAPSSEVFREQCVLGINLGKSKVVPIEDAVQDYEFSFRTLFALADYFVVNVSSPNTPGLRTLQERQPLEALLHRLAEVNRELSSPYPPDAIHCDTDSVWTADRKPILLKIAPDLTREQLDEIAEIAQSPCVDGIIATNTTISRNGLQVSAAALDAIGSGGLSGRPLFETSCQVVARLYDRLQGAKPVIGVGGIFSGADAWQMMCSGAALVQVYTGLIYEGPMLVQRINRYLLEQLEQRGIASISQAVGRRDWIQQPGEPQR